MKHSAIILIALVILLLGSCIPSLHPIYTKDDRIVDDRIVGNWYLGDKSKWAYHQDGDPQKTDPDQEQPGAFELDLDYGESSTWKFERAARISFDSENGSSSMVIEPVPVSYRSEGMTVNTIDSLPFYFLRHRELSADSLETKVLINLTRIGKHLFMDFLPQGLTDRQLEGRFGANYITGHTFARVEFEGDRLVIRPLDSEYLEKLIENKRIRLKHELIDDDRIVLTASTDELRAFIAKYADDEELYEEPEYLAGL